MMFISVWKYSFFTVRFSIIVPVESAFCLSEEAKLPHTSPSLNNLIISDLPNIVLERK